MREDDVIVTLETDKVSVDVRSPFEGKLVGLGEGGDELLGEGEEVDVGSAIFQIDISFKAPSSSSTTTEKKEVQKEKSSSLAPSSKPTPSTTQSQTSSPPPSKGGERGERRVKMSMMRRRIAERMKEAQETAAMLTTFQEVLFLFLFW